MGIASAEQLTGSFLEHRLKVSPETGEIFYCNKAGKWLPAGFKRWNGYINLSIAPFRKQFRAHHIVWVWAKGYWPKGEIDHINGKRDDNRIENLREVTVSQNRTNKTIQTNNKSGFKWVHFHKQNKKWCAEIHSPRSMGIGRKRLHQSFHDTAEAAYEAARDAALKIHGEFFNDGTGGYDGK